MNTSLLVIAIALLVCGATARTIAEPDNSISPSTSTSNGGRQRGGRGSNRNTEPKEFVKISEAPPTHIAQPIGTTIELECEATGSPPPTIQWLRGNGAITNIEDIVENNMISESSSTTLARVRSRLVIDHVASSDRTYTCVGRSGSQIAYSTTTISSEPGENPHNLTDLLSMSTKMLSGPKKPRIVHFYSVLLQAMGDNVVLPCKAVGRPRPEIHWMDINDNVINGQDPRFKVLNNGDLIISELRWADMGPYTCVARNPVARDTVTTFIYPILADE